MEARKKILVVDDTQMFRELEALFLGRLGLILTASSGAEALEIARREQPEVLIADLEMPGMEGDTLCRAIKADRDLHKTPVILVTSGESARDHARAVRAQADDVLSKPLSRIQLTLAVTRLLEAGSRRGLDRVAFDDRISVRLSRAEAAAWGVVRDLSRGGVFIESHGRLPLATEVDLDFRLPNVRVPMRPTAEVVWQGRHPKSGATGMGLRFLALDRSATAQIDAYVHERSGAEPATGSSRTLG